ncbi:hypothetical protein AVEN_142354-1 [Araneus ventricosus]|uniref:Uncharacterized protein n=1 Tax=Araneus ventricosus TaxID=182803 RepID=A0A4Y2LUT7_ARAVE|nr:hypothetical protein AVEN_142354-1 [Araneus ventricosus]
MLKKWRHSQVAVEVGAASWAARYYSGLPEGQRGDRDFRAINTLTPKLAVTGHTTSILAGRISIGCCLERGQKAVGRVVIKGTLRGEMKGLPFISPTTRSEKKREKGADESIPQIN